MLFLLCLFCGCMFLVYLWGFVCLLVVVVLFLLFLFFLGGGGAGTGGVFFRGGEFYVYVFILGSYILVLRLNILRKMF